MHELSLCQAIVDTVRGHAGGREVRAVDVRIGHLRQVVPDTLSFSWEVITDATELEGSELRVEHVPAVIRCRACGATTELDRVLLLCAGCESVDVEIVAGEELQIASLDVIEGVL